MRRMRVTSTAAPQSTSSTWCATECSADAAVRLLAGLVTSNSPALQNTTNHALQQNPSNHALPISCVCLDASFPGLHFTAARALGSTTKGQ